MKAYHTEFANQAYYNKLHFVTYSIYNSLSMAEIFFLLANACQSDIVTDVKLVEHWEWCIQLLVCPTLKVGKLDNNMHT